MAGSRTGHQFTPLCNLMVLTGGMRDQGRLHNEVYILNLDDGVWTKPDVQCEPPNKNAPNANERLRPGVTKEGAPTPRTGAMYVCMYVCMWVCMYMCYTAYGCDMCMYVSMYVCMYVCVYVCMYVCMYVCVHMCYTAYECDMCMHV